MSNPEASEMRHKWLGHFWVLNVLVVTYLYIFQPKIWAKASVFYLVLVSLYANVATEYGNAKSARAAQKADDSVVKKVGRLFK